MADEPTIDFSQVTGFQDALAQSPQAFLPIATDTMTESVRLIQGGMAEYPPETEANQPGRMSLKDHRPMGFYERGRGWWYPIMKRETLQAAASGKYGKTRGVVKASKLLRAVSQVQGYKLAAEGASEQLGKSWTTDVSTTDEGVTGEVGTNTSYADPVQGPDQAALMGKYGWTPMDEVVDGLMPDLDEIWSAAADQFVRQLAGA
jgi:hypothetical protein